ncbi:hypothetical protein RBWH47_04524 [Rhodopirellula baltica WH47]|uniref:Uncharacterized protein n=1 Tax=Rhodopirellula baltica WH47 TaxID=991778 RepID=F2AL66_RHOBT|nr:hypothetical protein RBWH47_04524 [Rhodopirellula baltica WH47]
MFAIPSATIVSASNHKTASFRQACESNSRINRLWCSKSMQRNRASTLTTQLA